MDQSTQNFFLSPTQTPTRWSDRAGARYGKSPPLCRSKRRLCRQEHMGQDLIRQALVESTPRYPSIRSIYMETFSTGSSKQYCRALVSARVLYTARGIGSMKNVSLLYNMDSNMSQTRSHRVLSLWERLSLIGTGWYCTAFFLKFSWVEKEASNIALSIPLHRKISSQSYLPGFRVEIGFAKGS